MHIRPNRKGTRGAILVIGGFILAFAVVGLVGRILAENNVRVAKPAPDFAFREQGANGPAIKLADFKGKALIVSFLATWDTNCQKQIVIFKDLLKQYGETNLAVLAFALDQNGPKAPKTYAEEQHLNYLLHVADYNTVVAFGGVTSIPTTFVIDKNQNIIQTYIGLTETNLLGLDLQAISKQ